MLHPSLISWEHLDRTCQNVHVSVHWQEQITYFLILFYSKQFLLFSSRSLDLQTLWKFCIGDPCLSTTSNAAYKDGWISWGNLELLISFSCHFKRMVKRLACCLGTAILMACKKKNNPPLRDLYSESIYSKVLSQTTINPSSANIHIQILQTNLDTFPLRISWENLIKHQGIFSFVIIFYILTTLSLMTMNGHC